MELWHVLSILTCALNCWEILLTTERFRYVIYKQLSTCLAGHMTTHSATIINSRCGPEWAVCVAKEVEQGVAAISKPCHYQDSNKYFVVLYLPVRLWQSRFVISLCECLCVCPSVRQITFKRSDGCQLYLVDMARIVDQLTVSYDYAIASDTTR